jgi:valyl-tRNA synthetase
MNVPPSRKATVIVVSDSDKVRDTFTDSRIFFATLGYANEVLIQSDKAGIPEDAVSTVIPGAVIYIPFADLVDIEKEIERLQKEKERLEGELKRVKGMLANENFVSKAPESKLVEERAKLDKYSDMMQQVVERLEHFSK